MVDEKKYQEAFASLMKDKSQRDALAEIIVEYVQPNHLTEEFISGLLTTRTLKPGDSLVKKVRKGDLVQDIADRSAAHTAHRPAEPCLVASRSLRVRVGWADT